MEKNLEKNLENSQWPFSRISQRNAVNDIRMTLFVPSRLDLVPPWSSSSWSHPGPCKSRRVMCWSKSRDRAGLDPSAFHSKACTPSPASRIPSPEWSTCRKRRETSTFNKAFEITPHNTTQYCICPAVFGHFSPASIKTGRAVRIQ